MSRVGKKPIRVPAGVSVAVRGPQVDIEGPKGKLSLAVPAPISVAVEGEQVVCARPNDDRRSRALHGLTRSLVQNMVIGVDNGFQKKLEIVGVGFGGVLEGNMLKLTVGFSNAVRVPVPEGVIVELPDATHINVSGPDKQKVGQFAAVVRAVRKPEPYKGTGIRYAYEQVRRKAGKAFGSAG